MRALALTIVVVLSTLPVYAEDLPASDASIKQLLDSILGQLDSVMRASMRDATQGQAFTAAQQTVVDDMARQLASIMREGMKWQSIVPMMVEIYRQNFTEKEIRGMIAFYQTPAGRAFVAKMLAVSARSLQAVQSRMAGVMPKIQALQKETVEKLKASSAAPADGQ